MRLDLDKQRSTLRVGLIRTQQMRDQRLVVCLPSLTDYSWSCLLKCPHLKTLKRLLPPVPPPTHTQILPELAVEVCVCAVETGESSVSLIGNLGVSPRRLGFGLRSLIPSRPSPAPANPRLQRASVLAHRAACQRIRHLPVTLQLTV